MNAPASRDGSVSFAVIDDSGKVIEAGRDIFNVNLCGYVVSEANEDDIFEPGEHISITQVTLCNNGEMTLPGGSLLSFASTPTVTFDATTATIPQLNIGENYVVPLEFGATLFDIPPPITQGPYSGYASFESRVQMLGRPFEDAFVATELKIQYPLKFRAINSPSQMGNAETNNIIIPLENISNKAIENQIQIRVKLGKFIVPTQHRGDEEGTLVFGIDKVGERQEHILSIEVELSKQSELLQRYGWRVELLYKGKMIEYYESEIRMAPIYNPDTSRDRSADILFFTSKSITRAEFVVWCRLFNTVNLSVDFWDIEKVKTPFLSSFLL